MTEEKLRNVKRKLVERLSQRELEERQYWQTTYQFLLDEGIVEGPYKNSTSEVTVRLATRLISRLPAKEYWGLEKRYVALEGKELSEEAQEDLGKYSKLERSANDYLRAELGNRPILRSEFEKMVENYLMNQTNLPNITSKENQRVTVIRVTTYLEGTFKVQEDPKKIGKYDIGSLESALDNL